jgi:hypothetical protein
MSSKKAFLVLFFGLLLAGLYSCLVLRLSGQEEFGSSTINGDGALCPDLHCGAWALRPGNAAQCGVWVENNLSPLLKYVTLSGTMMHGGIGNPTGRVLKGETELGPYGFPAALAGPLLPPRRHSR